MKIDNILLMYIVNGVLKERPVACLKNTEPFMRNNLSSVAIHIFTEKRNRRESLLIYVLMGKVLSFSYVDVSRRLQTLSDSGADCLRKQELY
jgi:hypothetical protein